MKLFVLIFLLNDLLPISNSFDHNLELTWLSGFSSCTNTLVALLPNNISFAVTEELSNYPSIILRNSDINEIEKIEVFNTKWITCRSFSIVFSSESEPSVQSTLLKLTLNVSTINPTRKTDYKTNAFSLSRYLFLVPLSVGNQLINADSLEKCSRILSTHVRESHDFIVNLANRNHETVAGIHA